MSAALKKLGERLREARLAAGISQAQLGAPYFTRAHVSAIELGKIRPAMRSLEHMARKLDKPASYFLDDADAERARKEHELEVGSIAGLLTFAGAPEALRRAERLLDAGDLTVRESSRLRLYAGSALNLLHRGNDATGMLAVAQRLHSSGAWQRVPRARRSGRGGRALPEGSRVRRARQRPRGGAHHAQRPRRARGGRWPNPGRVRACRARDRDRQGVWPGRLSRALLRDSRGGRAEGEGRRPRALERGSGDRGYRRTRRRCRSRSGDRDAGPRGARPPRRAAGAGGAPDARGRGHVPRA